jgi:hypothetical protein
MANTAIRARKKWKKNEEKQKKRNEQSSLAP